METYWQLLGKIGKQENRTALNIKISNKSVAKYLAEYIDDNELKLTEETLSFLFDQVVNELTENIMENFGYELKAIIPAVAETHGIATTKYHHL